MNFARWGWLPLVASLLGGCMTSTEMVRNEKVQGVTYTSVVLVSPPEDPRNLMPQVADKFRQLGMAVTIAPHDQPLAGRQGTGFFLTADGYLLTCAHVVGDEKRVSLWLGGSERQAEVIAHDEKQDLALLKMAPAPGAQPVPVSFRMPLKPQLGEAVSTLGFPMTQALGTQVRFGMGQLSSLYGVKDDPTQIQFSAQIQPGSSGSPLYDAQGRVIGIVSQTMSTAEAAQVTGAVPQNVNFAVRADTALGFIQQHAPAVHARLAYNQAADTEQLQSTVTRLRAGKGPLDDPAKGQLVAAVAYHSFWDIWYRFRFFIVKLFDAESGDILLVAGQDHDNLLSTEGKVIEATFDEIREAMAGMR